jgi:hypothetical protein
MDIEANYGHCLSEVWSKRPIGLLKNCGIKSSIFAIEKSIPNCDVLFIGMNPSVVSGQDEYYHMDDKIGYFKKLNDTCKEIKLGKWGHHDIYPIRCTNQSKIIKAKKKCQRKKDDFFEKLECITKDIIEKVNPKLIVVLNAGAGKIFSDMFKTSISYSHLDRNTGTFLIQLKDNSEPTHVIFSGMLSGQRALDVGSRISLQWHIRRVLDTLTTNM